MGSATNMQFYKTFCPSSENDKVHKRSESSRILYLKHTRMENDVYRLQNNIKIDHTREKKTEEIQGRKFFLENLAFCLKHTLIFHLFLLPADLI